MAMLRLPTKESGGRANLHQGALGVGVDIATGISTRAIWHGEQIVFKPGTERKTPGYKNTRLEYHPRNCVRAQIASGLGYAGLILSFTPNRVLWFWNLMPNPVFKFS